MLEDWVRPRWGIGSVRLHLDIEDLALALVLFDRVVLPSPDSPNEELRYEESGWEPANQAVRGVQLHPLVHFVTWDERLRAGWSEGMRRAEARLGPLAQDVEGLGYWETARVIAQSTWEALDRPHDDSDVHRPVPIAWCPRTEQALAKLGFAYDESADLENAPPVEVFDPSYDDGEAAVVLGADGNFSEVEPDLPVENHALLLSRDITVPPGDGEAMLEAAARLARDPGYVEARRSLYAATFALAAQNVPKPQIVDELAKAEKRYETKVDEYCKGGSRRRVHQILPVAAPTFVHLAGLQLPGSAWLVRRALTRFLPLPPRPDGGDSTGAALALARRVLPFMYTQTTAETPDTTLSEWFVETTLNPRSQAKAPD